MYGEPRGAGGLWGSPARREGWEELQGLILHRPVQKVKVHRGTSASSALACAIAGPGLKGLALELIVAPEREYHLF